MYGKAGIPWIRLTTGQVVETHSGWDGVLRPGRVLEGEILKAGPGRLLLSILGQRVEARSEVLLAEGSKVRLLVRSVEDGRLTLQVLDSGQVGQSPASVLPDVQPAVLPAPTGEGLIYVSLSRAPEEPDHPPVTEDGGYQETYGGGGLACTLVWESPALGSVRVSLRLGDQQPESPAARQVLKVDFAVDKPEARGLIREGFPQLNDGLKSAGYGVLDLTCRQARPDQIGRPRPGRSVLDRRL